MYRDHRVAVVVPAYNEERFVGEVIDTVPDFVDRIYPVDDGSTDDTWAEMCDRAEASSKPDDGPEPKAGRDGSRGSNSSDASPSFDSLDEFDGSDRRPAVARSGTSKWSVASDEPDEVDEPANSAGPDGSGTAEPEAVADGAGRVVPLRHGTNQGVGAAVKTGYRRALADDCDVIAVMNGDGQMPPDALDRLLDPIVAGRADYTKGDRLQVRDALDDMSRWRLFGNALLTSLTKASSGYWRMNDSQNGYTAISATALDRVNLDEIYDGYGFLNDLLTTLNVHGMTIADVPHEAVYGEEHSDIDYTRFVPALSGLLAVNFGRRLLARYLVRDFHPTVFCYPLGFAGLFAGGVSIAAAIGPLDGRGSILGGMLAALLVIVGAFVLSVAVALDIQQNEPLEVEP